MLFATIAKAAQRAERVVAQWVAETEDDRPLWRDIARPEQLAPDGNWRTWLLLCGRGWGKTKTGAEHIIEYAKAHPKSIIHLVGRSAADVRDVMVGGDSGILKCSRYDFLPYYEPSKRRLTWPNGTYALCFSAEEPDQLRGPQCHYAWADELAAWKCNASAQPVPEAWDQLLLGLRLGKDPRVIVTTTPRPTKVVRDLIATATTFVTRGRTFDNARNLAGAFLEKIVAKYQGTRLGQQELEGLVLDDSPGALWKRSQIEADRVLHAPTLVAIVVAVDPAATASEESDETGIVVVGICAKGHGYLLDDFSGRYSPDEWATKAVMAHDFYEADRIVAEVNHGGDMIGTIVRRAAKDMHEKGARSSPDIAYRTVRASKGKAVRAEPVAQLCEQHRVHHVTCWPGRADKPAFLELEDQLCNWDPATTTKSPDRLDTYVWAVTDLRVGSKTSGAKTQASAKADDFWTGY